MGTALWEPLKWESVKWGGQFGLCNYGGVSEWDRFKGNGLIGSV